MKKTEKLVNWEKYWETVGFITNGLPADFFARMLPVANIGQFLLLPFSWSDFLMGTFGVQKTATFCFAIFLKKVVLKEVPKNREK